MRPEDWQFVYDFYHAGRYHAAWNSLIGLLLFWYGREAFAVVLTAIVVVGTKMNKREKD